MTDSVKTALVTGASRGIGQAIAKQLGGMGFAVIRTATSDAGAEKISAYLQAAGISGQGMKLNVADADSISAVIKAISNEYGNVDVLVNNAGITKDNL